VLGGGVPVQVLQMVHRAVDHQAPGVALEPHLQRPPIYQLPSSGRYPG
jgi:hypothetical protein